MSGALQPSGLLSAGNALLNVLFAVLPDGRPRDRRPAARAVRPADGAGRRPAGIFLAMAVILVTSRDLPVPESGDAAGARGVARALEALRFVRSSERLRRIVGVHAATLVCTMLLSPVEVIFARELTGRDASYGLMLAVWGAGTVLGSLVFARLRSGATREVTAGAVAVIGAGMLVMSVSPVFGLALVGSLLGGAGNGVWSVSVINRIQHALPGAFQARVMGLLESVVAAASGVGFLIAGLLEGGIGARGVIAVAGRRHRPVGRGLRVGADRRRRCRRPGRRGGRRGARRRLRPLSRSRTGSGSNRRPRAPSPPQVRRSLPTTGSLNDVTRREPGDVA